MSNTAANPLLPLRLNEIPLVGNPPTSGAAATAVALLTQRLAAGEEEAFREFHRIYFDRLYHFLLAVTGGQEQEAQEALQETLLRLLRHPRFLRTRKFFGAGSRRWRATPPATPTANSAATLPCSKISPWAAAAFPPRTRRRRNRLGALLEESLDELEPADRLLIENKYLAGETVRELSMLAGLSDKAVESRLLRLRRHLRERIMEKLRTP